VPRISRCALVPVLIAFICSAAFAQQFIYKPSTTLALQRANNTSAASSFAGLDNGIPAPGNVSKLSTSSLLYPHNSSTVYAQFEPWFGQSTHINVGYSSDSAAQVQLQVQDMLSRGIHGVIVDWYGPNAAIENSTTLLMMTEAQNNPGFTFAVQEDAGALTTCANTVGCNVTQQLISDLTYAYNTYEGSPSYMTIHGRPAVFCFGVDQYPINWTTVLANVPGNPYIMFNGFNGTNLPQANGYYTWVEVDASNPNDESLSVLSTFYSAMQATTDYTVGAAYIGFNESAAPWITGTPRIMNQKCGQTWLDTFHKTDTSGYSPTNQLPALQVVTWNDYEEGTAIEAGISNCIVITPSIAANSLNWSITGNEVGVKNYAVYISRDGEALMPLATVASGTHTLNLTPFYLTPSTTFQLLVQAVGQPSFLNVTSSPVSYTTPAAQKPAAVLTISVDSGPAPLSVTASTAGSSSPDAPILSSTLNFGDGSAAVAGLSATHIYRTAGTYTVTATVTDALGATASATRSVKVAAPCTISTTNRTITICNPGQYSTDTSPVTVLGYATDTSTIHSMSIVVDGKVVFTQTSATREINVPVTIAVGLHSLVVEATDSRGTFTHGITMRVP